MRTKAEMPEEKKKRFLEIAKTVPCTNGIKPERFIKLLKTNTGVVDALNKYGLDENGLELRNPLIVAFGDSVTGGHFESLHPIEEILGLIEKGEAISEPIGIRDLNKVYHEQFKMMLVDKYIATSVSVVNSGIAGDSIIGMEKRVYRDVIQHKPDLVIINGTLNWNPESGSLDDFRSALENIIHAIKKDTSADIILLTPNAISGMLPDELLEARVEIVRDVAKKEKASLVDAYKLWSELTTDKDELKQCLSNEVNHPTAAGHTVFALALMQLFQ
jgi:lysophospholipase L1-like esterase